MANLLRGEVAFEAGGVTYTFRLTLNQLLALHQRWKISPRDGSALFERLKESGQNPADLRDVFAVGLSSHHPEITDAEAGDAISAVTLPVAAGSARACSGRSLTRTPATTVPGAVRAQKRPLGLGPAPKRRLPGGRLS